MGSRTYSDPSFGSQKTLYSQIWSCGTRAAAGLVEQIDKPMTSIEVVDWNILNTVTATGGNAVWILAATSSLGTHNVGTMTMTGTHNANAYIDGSITTTGTTHLVGEDGKLNLYSGLSTASPSLLVRVNVQYKEKYVQGEN